MSKNLSTNLSCRVNASYQGKRSLYFDLPSLYSYRTWNPLLSEFPCKGNHLDTARFVKLLYSATEQESKTLIFIFKQNYYLQTSQILLF